METINAVLFHEMNFSCFSGKVTRKPKKVKSSNNNGIGSVASLETTPQKAKNKPC